MSLTLNTMSLKLKVILVAVGIAVITAGWFLIVFRPGQHKVADLHTQVATERQQVAALEGQLRHLQALQRNEPKLKAQLARFATALPTDPGLPQFILQIQDAANKAGVDFLSVAPSLPTVATTASKPATAAAPAASPAPGASAAPAAGTPTTDAASGLKQIGVAITTTGKYFTLENFIYRLEHLNRALRIDTFSIAGGGAASTGSAGTGASSTTAATGALSVSLNMRMFMMPSAVSQPTTSAPGASKAGA